ncbi:MAG TPA: hydrogenase [Ignisphaera aggregans]|uniref:Hydrogenase n=1 Tax=Ignisphaera aggregans TaxID=334771 RepID=A0A833DUY8_9CREN|nr:hydrogenase [Ignisphaera aggregans]
MHYISTLIATVIAIVLGMGLAPLLDGISRKVKARLQYRQGPPIVQTFYDLAKLLRMESVLPTESRLFVLAPYIAFASALAAMTTLPIGTIQPLSFTGDIFVFLYVLAMVSISMMLAGFVVPNTYSGIGANREMMLILSIEPVLGMGIGILALLTGSLSLIDIMRGIATLDFYKLLFAIVAYLLLMYAIYVEGGFIPFDVAEAETEILEGPLCEYSGRLLGFFKWALLIKRVVLVWLYSSLIVIPIVTALKLGAYLSFIVTFILQLFLTVVMYVGIAVIEALNARYRIDHVISYNTRVLLVSILIFIVVAVSVYV